MNKKTCLFDEHQKLHARFTEFGGWDMPVFYTTIMEEHAAVRNNAGLFDTSHMGEITVGGAGAVAFLNRMTTVNVPAITEGQARYGFLLNEAGGVIDDLIIYRRSDDFLLIVNASNADKDFEWLRQHQTPDATMERLNDLCLLALQGPASEKILQPLIRENLEELKYYYSVKPTFKSLSPSFAFLARTGYTGEDGFEILVNSSSAVPLWNALLAAGAKPCGLGCRDTLRLEAGMPLHGHEIDETTTPLEAGLGRTIFWDKEFIGKQALIAQKEKGLSKFLTAFRMAGGIPRAHCAIMINGRVAGQVVSGTFSPTLKTGIGMGFVNRQLESGTKIDIIIHDQPRAAEIVRRPFYKRKS
ncbi:MAG: hypothetical protein A2314_06790 [Elusimicrobia bacterium RIFOXYB2_FULL_50_12]|nr:MAG: hypothetical protein A2314_06790 [Elusimicrobia bacterium RIFOXYB2_FULL_50_12]